MSNISKVEIGLYWPELMLANITKEAIRLDVSLSWCVQKSWQLARSELCTLEPVSSHSKAEEIYRNYFSQSNKRKQTLFFPDEMADEIRIESERQDRSQSWLLQRAWCLAVEEIEKIHSVEL